MDKRSAFDNTPISDWLKKNTYKSKYEDKLYKHKSKSNPVAKKTVAKAKTPTKPKKNLIGSALAEHKRTRKPYKIVNKLIN